MAIDYSKLSDEELDKLAESGVAAPAAPTERRAITEMSNEELQAVVAADEPEVEAEEPATLQDLQRGNSGSRLMTGVSSLLMGPLQLGANVGDELVDSAPGQAFKSIAEPLFWAAEKLGISARESELPVGEELNAGLKQYRESSNRGQKALGRGEFDAWGLAGSAVAGLPAVLKMTGAAGAAGAGAILGGATPVDEGDNFWGSKAIQTGAGAAGGAALHGAGKGLTAAGRKIRPYLTTDKQATNLALRSITGDKADDIAKALKADDNPLTLGSPGEVAVPAQSTKFSALQRAMDAEDTDEAFKRVATQNTERQKVLTDIADLEAPAKGFREEITAPMREASLEAAKKSGINASGVDGILDGVDKVMKTPNVVGNPTLKAVMKKVKKDLAAMVDDGSIDPAALYNYRKTGLNTTIERFANANPNITRGVTEALTDVRPLLDDAIDTAAGGGWKKYLKAYEKLSRPVDQGRVGKVLKNAYTNALSEGRVAPARLAKAVEEAEGTLRKSGVRASELKDVLNPDQLGGLTQVRADLTRADEFAQLASAGAKSSSPALPKSDSLQLANPLLREIMVANYILKGLSEKQAANVAQEMKILFKRDPELGYAALAEAIKKASPKDKSWLRKLGEKLTGEVVQQVPKVPGLTAEIAE
jgi:hypothetical protein